MATIDLHAQLRSSHHSRVYILVIDLIFLTINIARRVGSDGSMSASCSAGPGFDPGGVVNFHLRIFNLEIRRGGDVHFLIARLYITWLD